MEKYWCPFVLKTVNKISYQKTVLSSKYCFKSPASQTILYKSLSAYLYCTFFVFLFCISGSDGLMKLWTIKSNECVKTFDEHEDKVWALAVSKTETVAVTGGADSTIIIWKVGFPVWKPHNSSWVILYFMGLNKNFFLQLKDDNELKSSKVKAFSSTQHFHVLVLFCFFFYDLL